MSRADTVDRRVTNFDRNHRRVGHHLRRLRPPRIGGTRGRPGIMQTSRRTLPGHGRPRRRHRWQRRQIFKRPAAGRARHRPLALRRAGAPNRSRRLAEVLEHETRPFQHAPDRTAVVSAVRVRVFVLLIQFSSFTTRTKADVSLNRWVRRTVAGAGLERGSG